LGIRDYRLGFRVLEKSQIGKVSTRRSITSRESHERREVVSREVIQVGMWSQQALCHIEFEK
jgi:hypothetical protein